MTKPAGKMEPDVARKVEDGIRAEWAVLRSMLADAIDRGAWKALGHASQDEWLAELIPDRDLPGIGTPAPPPGAPVQARVSRPGRKETTRARPGRGTQVNTYFKHPRAGAQ